MTQGRSGLDEATVRFRGPSGHDRAPDPDACVLRRAVDSVGHGRRTAVGNPPAARSTHGTVVLSLSDTSANGTRRAGSRIADPRRARGAPPLCRRSIPGAGRAGFHRGGFVSTSTDHFPRDTAGLPASRPSDLVEVPDGGRVELRVAPVTKQIGGATVRMLAYNGSIPGPTLRVRQGSEIEVDVVNEGDMDATVHWHGLRLDNRFDGTHETQAPIPIGGRFASRVTFPDPGVYWYHPHIREDYGQEMGLYGNVLVEAPDP